MRITRSVTIASLIPALMAVQAASSEPSLPRLARTTELASAPQGERTALLMAGTPIRVLETSGGWTKVQIEGWIPAGEAPGDQAATVASAAAEAPAPAPTGGGRISGSIFVTAAGGKTFAGSRIAVRLLREAGESRRELETIRSGCVPRHKALEMESEALRQKADRALKTVESTSQAFEAYDEAKRQRARKLREMQAADDECLARIESVLDGRAVARGLSNADGRYEFAQVAAGAYLLQASLEADGLRHQWEIEVELQDGQTMSLDLTNTNRTRVEEIPVYR